ncbi:geranylgeranyl diphosphate synthase type II [Alkalibacillus filiformis]|uniref:Geranylgeranyl diphosphate synthase type II n=1 Tax=Alkalibacillus filiformis TaxID=200990 RepID=A0ABU0DRA8_9BACI|nr:farnesyl diphosphate synthase [Alkalibacillus filiformis]MDQ0350978.1 geranylgeranyl diphosphate synthase type II [Alkalibacillus filiformis]
MNILSFEQKQQSINEQLQNKAEQLDLPEQLKLAVIYALNAGGKRLRPILMLAAYNAFSENEERVSDVVVALELIHTYSLIHDDLPAMDNDDFRRGQPTIHKQYDEATAILVGDGLLTLAFQVISSSADLEAEEKVFTITELSKASGLEGMIAGQYLDLKGEGEQLTVDELSMIHRRKTGELIRGAVKIGAYLGGATPPQIEALDEYASYLGLIFQVQDDILDVTGDENKIGKPVGSDVSLDKSTYPKLLGIDGAIEKRDDYMERAQKALREARVENTQLMDIIELFGKRSY